MASTDNIKALTRADVDYILGPDRFPTTPKLHQGISVIWAAGLDRPRVMFWHDVGTGKTLTALYAMRVLGFDRLLVVCPNTVVEEWGAQIDEHTDGLTYTLLRGTADHRRQLLETADSDIFVINYEGLRSLFGRYVGKKIKGKKQTFQVAYDVVQAAGFDALVIDECHRLQDARSQVTRMCRELSRGAEKVIEMSGTPYSTSMADLWAQYDVLDSGRVFSQSRAKFLKRWFDLDYFGNPTLKNGVREDFLRTAAPVTLRYDREECFDLPPKTYETRRFDLSKEQREWTRRIVRGEFVQTDRGELGPQEVLHVGNKLAQVAAGFLILDDDDRTIVRVAGQNPKLEGLRGLTREIPADRKVVIFHSYQEEGRMIEELLPDDSYASLRSEVTDKAVQIGRFREDPDCRFLIAHPRSGGEGLNFQIATTMIFYGNGCFGAPVRTQAEGRIWRLGQNAPCLYFDLVMRDSIDETRLERMAGRTAISQAILAFIRDFAG